MGSGHLLPDFLEWTMRISDIHRRSVAVTGIYLLLLSNPGCYVNVRNSKRLFLDARLTLNEVGRALENFRRDAGRYPTTSEGLAALVRDDGKVPGWKGPYMAWLGVDPWGQSFVYEYVEGKDTYKVISLGEDKSPGGVGAASDLVVGPDSYERILKP